MQYWKPKLNDELEPLGGGAPYAGAYVAAQDYNEQHLKLAGWVTNLDAFGTPSAIRSELTRWRAMFSSPDICAQELRRMRKALDETAAELVHLSRENRALRERNAELEDE